MGNTRKVRVIQWNVSWEPPHEPKIDLLRREVNKASADMPVVVAMQEVKKGFQSELTKACLLPQLAFSLDLRPPGPKEGGGRELGCAIGCSEGLELSNPSLIARALLPERTLTAELHWKDLSFLLVAFHSLTGVKHKRAKSLFFDTVNDHLCQQKGRMLVFCGDANEPEIDHPDPALTRFFDQRGDKGDSARGLFGENADHGLRDAFRLQPGKAEELCNAAAKRDLELQAYVEKLEGRLGSLTSEVGEKLRCDLSDLLDAVGALGDRSEKKLWSIAEKLDKLRRAPRKGKISRERNTSDATERADREKLGIIKQDVAKKLELMLKAYKNSPLETSHRTGAKKMGRRFDFIYVSPHWQVTDMRYTHFDRNTKNASDHAMAIADLSLLEP